MREILFRGKSVNDDRWVFGDLSNYGDCKTITTVKDFTIIDSCEVIPETVGQYTGLTDKNGRRIFENGYMIIDDKTYKVIFDAAEYILTNIFNCDIITLKNNSIKGVFVDEI